MPRGQPCTHNATNSSPVHPISDEHGPTEFSHPSSRKYPYCASNTPTHSSASIVMMLGHQSPVSLEPDWRCVPAILSIMLAPLTIPVVAIRKFRP